MTKNQKDLLKLFARSYEDNIARIERSGAVDTHDDGADIRIAKYSLLITAESFPMNPQMIAELANLRHFV